MGGSGPDARGSLHPRDRRAAPDLGGHGPPPHRRRAEETAGTEPRRGAEAAAERLTARSAGPAHPLGHTSVPGRDEFTVRLRPRTATPLAALIAGSSTDVAIL